MISFDTPRRLQRIHENDPILRAQRGAGQITDPYEEDDPITLAMIAQALLLALAIVLVLSLFVIYRLV